MGWFDFFWVIIVGYIYFCYNKERKKKRERELFVLFKINDKKICLMILFYSFMFKKYLLFCIENLDLYLYFGNNFFILYVVYSSFIFILSYDFLVIVLFVECLCNMRE